LANGNLAESLAPGCLVAISASANKKKRGKWVAGLCYLDIFGRWGWGW